MEGVEVPLQGVRKTGERYNGQYAGSRIVVNLKSISTWGDNPQGVMRHELAHAITARKTMVSLNLGGELGAPTWAMEGFARWTETIDNPQRMAAVRSDVANGVAAGKFHGKVPKSKDFYGNDISFNYDLSATVFAFIERVKGREAAVEFYASIIEYSDNLDTAVADAPIFTGICKRVLGVDGPTFTGQWASFVRGGA
jgi:hypothetical protein